LKRIKYFFVFPSKAVGNNFVKTKLLLPTGLSCSRVIQSYSGFSYSKWSCSFI